MSRRGPGLSSRLNRQVDILKQSEVDDGLGGSAVVWSPVAEGLAAEVKGLSGREVMLEKVLQGVTVYRITLRYRPFETAWQIRYGQEDLNVRSAVDPDGRRDELVIIADTDGAMPTR